MTEQQAENAPLVNIVMATYNPRMDWFEEQLKSLNSQTYENIKITIIDDCSNAVSFEEIKGYVQKNITKFPFSIQQNENNLGSNKTFEKLTEMADGEYIAYCDQDDVWLPEKIEIYVSEIKKQKALLVCSDMYIIDSEGRQKADSITKVRRHHVFKSGEGLAEQLLFSNFVTGCAMMTKTDIGKKAIPFCPYMVHDHYLALYSANQGNLAFINRPLINYRIHGNNQTAMMLGVKDKESYVKARIDLALYKMYWLEDSFVCEVKLKEVIQQGIIWLKARKNNLEGRRGERALIYKYRSFSRLTSLFEIIATYLPDKAFMLCIDLKKRNFL